MGDGLQGLLARVEKIAATAFVFFRFYQRLLAFYFCGKNFHLVDRFLFSFGGRGPVVAIAAKGGLATHNSPLHPRLASCGSFLIFFFLLQ